MSSPGPLCALGLSAGIALVAACSGGDGDATSAPDAALDDGWIGTLVASPDQFSGVVEGPARAGWVALHGGDLKGAAEQLPDGIGRARARWALATTEADLARLSHRVWELTYQTWSQRGGIPAGSAIPIVAALNALDADDPDGAKAWLARGGSYASADLSAAALSLGAGLKPLASAALPCVNAELAARASLDRTTLSDCGGAPLLSEGTGDAPRKLYDPLLFTTLARIDRAAAAAAVGGKAPGEALAPDGQPGLESLLFSPWWSAADLRADLALDPTLAGAGAAGPGWLGAGPLIPAAAPSADAARDRVGRLDRLLDAWLARRHEKASDAGRELLDNLELGPVWRSQVLVGWARAALAADRPTEALVYVQCALDLTHPRALGPRNPPALFVLMADATLRTGHAREALDALQPLRDAWPELAGLTETLGDLVVLEGIGRPGDSKEN